MDRADLWLNARQGWAREALTWVILAPMALNVGLAGWAGTGETWWIPTPLALIALGQVARRVRPRRGPSRRGRAAGHSQGAAWTPPEFSWRRMAGTLLLAPLIALLFISTRLDTSAWQHWHRAFALLYLTCLLGASVLWYADRRYTRRLRQRATRQPSA